MGLRAQAAIGSQSIAWWSARMHRLHPGTIVGEERRDHQLPEAARARLNQPQPPRPGNAAPRPLLRRLAERFRLGRRIGPGAARALDDTGTLTRPLPVVPGGTLPRATEALAQKVEAAPRELGTSLTGGRRALP
jgi:hypothetical protein